MKQQHLIKFFQRLGKGYYRPNCGGCGLFAYAASRALDSIGIEHKIVVCCWDSWQVREFNNNYGKVKSDITRHYRQYLATRKGKGLHNHIAIEINGDLYDTDGLWRPDNLELKARIDIRTLKQLILDGSQWNSVFWCNNDDNKTEITYVALKAEKLSKQLAI